MENYFSNHETVIFINKDIKDLFDQEDIDAIFLDLPYGFDYLQQVRKALSPGVYF